MLGRPIVARHEADVTVECVSDDAHDEESTRSPVTKEKTRQQDAPTSPDKASDPNSDFVTQQNDCGDSPQREKKQTFAQAELEEVGPVTVDTEDNMRRRCENHVRELRTFFTLSQSHASNVHFFCETLSLPQDFQ